MPDHLFLSNLYSKVKYTFKEDLKQVLKEKNTCLGEIKSLLIFGNETIYEDFFKTFMFYYNKLQNCIVNTKMFDDHDIIVRNENGGFVRFVWNNDFVFCQSIYLKVKNNEIVDICPERSLFANERMFELSKLVKASFNPGYEFKFTIISSFNQVLEVKISHETANKCFVLEQTSYYNYAKQIFTSTYCLIMRFRTWNCIKRCLLTNLMKYSKIEMQLFLILVSFITIKELDCGYKTKRNYIMLMDYHYQTLITACIKSK